ncbi:hypothetical protein [Streptomyces griseoluteus]|uniref:hypothetical protein n=1 Tax=Streptomyces griseoluteus TaxID=29306 RepID=UPI0036FE338A
MAREPGASKPTVNRGFKELRECGLAWGLEDGRYQLHPLLTGGAVSSPVMKVPEIRAAEPGRFTEQRRARYAAQTANLAATGEPTPTEDPERPSTGLRTPVKTHGRCTFGCSAFFKPARDQSGSTG